MEQLVGYLDTLGEAEGWRFRFDQRQERPWEERLWRQTRTVSGKTLHLIGA